LPEGNLEQDKKVDKTVQNIIDEQVRLESDRKVYESLKELCISLAYPDRSDQYSLYGGIHREEGGEGKPNRGRRIYDATAIKSREIWSAGIMSHFMPKEINWFTEEMGDKKLMQSKRVRKWLQDTDEHLVSVLNRSNPNYYEQKLVRINDAGVIGDSFMYIDQDPESDRLMFQCPHPRQFWSRRDYWGRPLVIHEKFTKTIDEIKGEFGENGLSDEQKLQLEKNPNNKIEVIHGVYRNTDYEPDKIGVKNMKWQHYYINVVAKKIIRSTGTEVLNPIGWSLNRPSHELYGRGIVSQMLIEIITANFISKDILTASQIAVKPPMLITSAIKHKLDLGAGGVTYVGSRETQGLKMGDLIARLVDSSGYPFGIDQQQKWQIMVEERFGVPLFLALNSDSIAKTYGEVRERKAERATLMSPFFGTLTSTTDEELDRVYSLEFQAGRTPEPPMEVFESQNRHIDIEYIGPITQLLKQYYETGSLLNTIMNIQQVLSVAPQAGIVVEGDELMRKILKSGNSPEEIILTADEVTELRAIAQQQQEGLMQMELAEKAAKAVPNLGKKIERDSVLSNLAKMA
jgi:hypothetical protein